MSTDIETKKQGSKPVPKLRGKKDILRAQPVKGDIDHEKLSREFIARFPKLRAALAK